MPFAASITTLSGRIASSSTNERTLSTKPRQTSCCAHRAATLDGAEGRQRASSHLVEAGVAAHGQRAPADDLHAGVLLRVVRGGDADAAVEPELTDCVVDHLGADHPEVVYVSAAVCGALDQRLSHRRSGEAHVASDGHLRARSAPRTTPHGVRALLVDLRGVDPAHIVGLEHLRVEHRRVACR